MSVRSDVARGSGNVARGQLAKVVLKVRGRIFEQCLEGHEVSECWVPTARIVHTGRPLVIAVRIDFFQELVPTFLSIRTLELG